MRTTSNFIFKKMLTVLLSVGLLVSSFSPVIVNADETENETGGGTETTEVVETDETSKQENNEDGGEDETTIIEDNKEETSSDDSSTIKDEETTDDTKDSFEEASVEKTLQGLIDSLPTSEEYKAILESNDEDKYNEVASLLEQIEELADENNIDLSTYDKYVALFSESEEADNLDETSDASLSIHWTDADGTKDNGDTIDYLTYRESVYALIEATFPASSENRTITILPNTSLYIREDGTNSKNETFKNSVTIEKFDSNTLTVAPNITNDSGVSYTYKTYNTGRKYTVNKSNPNPVFGIELRNSVGTLEDGNGQDNTRLWSNGATNGAGCVTVVLEYTLNGGTKSITKELNITKFERVIPKINGAGNYYTETEPKLLLKTDTDTTTNNIISFYWYGENSNNVYFNNQSGSHSVVKASIVPMKSIKFTFTVTKGLLLDLDGTGWVIDQDYTDNGDGTQTVVIAYAPRSASENFWWSNGGYLWLQFRPKVYFSDEIQNLSDAQANGMKFQLHMKKAEFIQIEDIQPNIDKTTASGTEKTYTFTDEQSYKYWDGSTHTVNLPTCYYEIEDLQSPFVVQFKAGINHTVEDDHVANSINDIAWYNEDYKDNIGIVSILNYGLYGTRNITEPSTVKMTFDNTYVGVKAVRLPMDREQANNILNGNKTFTVYWKSNKKSDLQTTTISSPTGFKNTVTGDNFSYIYVNSKDLGLANDEYLTEIRYQVDQIKPTYTSTAAGNVYQTGRSSFDYGWVLGKILNYQKDATYTCTIQLFKDTNCTAGQELTGLGVVTSKISDQKRVNLKVDGVSVNGKRTDASLTIAAGDELTMTSKISYKDLTDVYGNKGNIYSSKALGYTPVTAIYIRDLFGTGISNLTIKNTQTGNYLLENVTIDDSGKVTGGTVFNGVTLTLDHTEEASTANNNYAVKVYKVTIDRSELNNRYDCVVGHYTENAYTTSKFEDGNLTDYLEYAKLTVSWKTKVDDHFGDVDESTDLPVRLEQKFEAAQTLYAESDNNTETVSNVVYQSHNNYTSVGSGANNHIVQHIDEFDVNTKTDSNHYTKYASSTAQTGNAQGDPYIVRAQNGTKLAMEQPTKRTKLVIEGTIKESDQTDSSYRSYDSKNPVTSTVDLTSSDAKLRILAANFGTSEITEFNLFVIIPKKGQVWGSQTAINGYYNDQTGFNFTVNLTGAFTNPFENDTNYPFDITYASITPITTEDGLMYKDANDKYVVKDGLNFVTSDKVTDWSSINIVRIHANKLQSSTSTETAVQQLKRTKYFVAPIAYGDGSAPSSTLYDIWSCVAYYREVAGTDKSNAAHKTDSLGLRVVAPKYTVTTTVNNGQKGTETGVTETNVVTYGTNYTVTVSADDCYKLPETISVTVTKDGVDETIDPDNYTYDSKTGKITIPGKEIVGDIKVVVTCVTNLAADGVVTYNGATVSDETLAKIEIDKPTPNKGETVTATVTVSNKGYDVDISNIKVTVGGTSVANPTVDNTKASEGIIKVSTENISGNVHFEVPLVLKTFSAETKVTNGTNPSNDGETATYGVTYHTTVQANDSYKLPKNKSSIKVEVDGERINVFTYNPSTGEIVIPGNKVTGNIVVTVECTPFKADAILTYNGKTFTDKNIAKVEISTDSPKKGTDLTATVTINNSNFEVDENSISVTVDGNAYNNYTFENNIAKVSGADISGDVRFVIPLKTAFTVKTTTPNGSSTTTDTDTPTYGTPYTTTVTPNKGYELPKDKTSITVTVDGNPLKPEDFDYNEETGEITVHGDKITGNIVINVPCNPIELDADGVDIIETSSTTIEVANSDKTGKYENILASIDVDKAYYNTELTATATVKNPNFKIDKDNISVEVKEADGSTITYNADSEYVTISSNTNTGRSLKGTNIQADEATTIYESYTVTLAASKVTGKVHFIVPLVENTPVETDVVNGEQGNNDGIKVEADPSNPLMTKEYTTEIKADDGYVLPSTIDAKTSDGSKAITIIIGGKEITDFTYTPILKDGKVVSATITIPGQSLLNATKLEYKINVVASKVNTNSNTNNNTNPPKRYVVVNTSVKH